MALFIGFLIINGSPVAMEGGSDQDDIRGRLIALATVNVMEGKIPPDAVVEYTATRVNTANITKEVADAITRWNVVNEAATKNGRLVDPAGQPLVGGVPRNVDPFKIDDDPFVPVPDPSSEDEQERTKSPSRKSGK